MTKLTVEEIDEIARKHADRIRIPNGKMQRLFDTARAGIAQREGGWQDIATAPSMKRVLVCVPLDKHRLVLGTKSMDGIWLDERMQPMPYPPFWWLDVQRPKFATPQQPDPRDSKREYIADGKRQADYDRHRRASDAFTQQPDEDGGERAVCGLCGEPLPEGEEMFKYHGYSGPCPTPEQIEESTCTCGAGHGSGEGHTEWCEWVEKQPDEDGGAYERVINECTCKPVEIIPFRSDADPTDCPLHGAAPSPIMPEGLTDPRENPLNEYVPAPSPQGELDRSRIVAGYIAQIARSDYAEPDPTTGRAFELHGEWLMEASAMLETQSQALSSQAEEIARVKREAYEHAAQIAANHAKVGGKVVTESQCCGEIAAAIRKAKDASV